MGKVTRFYQRTIANIKGDQDAIIALDNEALSSPTLEAQEGQTKFKLAEQKSKIITAKKNFEEAKYPRTRITSGNTYYQGIVNAKKELDKQEDILIELEESLEFTQSLRKEFEERVELEEVK